MKTVDTRILQHNLGSFLDQVASGSTLEVHRRHKPIARIVPWSGSADLPAWPDIEARLKQDFPDGPLVAGASRQLYDDRGE